jgi:hypothetical protein
MAASATKPSKREQERKRKEAEAKKVRDAKIKSGDLIVSKGVEFEKIGKDTKTYKRAQKVLAILEKSKAPVVVADVAKSLSSFYEDVLPQFAMLEAQGLAVRYEARGGGRGRRSVAYLHKNNTK